MGVTMGVDVGGSHVTAILYDGKSILAREDVAFPPKSKSTDVVETIKQSVFSLSKNGGPLPPVGVGIPGIIDSTGIVRLAPNLNIRDFDIRAALARCGIRSHIINDANAAALGEWQAGSGVGTKNLVCLTVGTGIGSGVVVDGKPVNGFGGRAGEIGHMIIKTDGPQCGCGMRGCLESLASATAIATAGAKRALAGDEVLRALAQEEGEDPSHISAKTVFRGLRMGSPGAREVIGEAAFWLGTALSNVVVVIDPDVIVIGGGVGLAGDDFLEPVRETMRKNVLCSLRETPVVQASLKTLAGVIGAAVFAAQGEEIWEV